MDQLRLSFVLVLFVIPLHLSCGRRSAETEGSTTASITDPSYTGKKRYFGWGEKLSGSMGNETKYDVEHTHNLFTKNIGGSYTGTKLSGEYFNGTNIRNQWTKLKTELGPDDMYVQYSSGHGSTTALGVGVSYHEIRDRTLALNAKETIVFTMACYSGNLVDSFERKRAEWADYQSRGKTLFVMASSQSGQTSSTGPGVDPDEAGGPNGSAGSAFGHALWKALIGYADGAVDQVKDKEISLGELIKYTVAKTKAVGRHTPKYTGAYDPTIVIAKVPSRAELEAILSDTYEGRMELESILNDRILD